MEIPKFCDLEILQINESRAIVGVKDEKNDGLISSLIPSKNSIVVLLVRFKGGIPFSMTVDADTFNDARVEYENAEEFMRPSHPQHSLPMTLR